MKKLIEFLQAAYLPIVFIIVVGILMTWIIFLHNLSKESRSCNDSIGLQQIYHGNPSISTDVGDDKIRYIETDSSIYILNLDEMRIIDTINK